jgi:hypothetical protein
MINQSGGQEGSGASSGNMSDSEKVMETIKALLKK